MRKGEMLSKIFGTTLAVLVIFSICGALPGIANVEPVAASPGIIIYVPDDYATIQAAVDNATATDTIIVRDGTYPENVDVNKTLTIQSENGTANCVVNATNSNDHVFSVTADWVNITGFTVENATGVDKGGIYLSSAGHCNISNNNATNNYYGIHLTSSSNNTLTNNTASNNSHNGIILIISCDYNTLTNNTASNNTNYGIHLTLSSNNTVTNNTASNNDYGIWVVEGSSNNTLTNNTISNNSYGVYLWSAVHVVNHCNIFGNNLSNNDYGIYLNSSSNNTIYNNCFNNTNNAWDDGNNTWNTTKQVGTNIMGGPYLGGNYWSDYSGNDTDGDGLGNTEIPHNCTGNITNGGDYLPLMVWIGATLQGNVSFYRAGGAGNPTWETPIVVRFFDNSSKVEMDWSPINVTTDDYGNFTITGLTPGTYDIGIKNWTCLSRVGTNVTLTAGNTTVVDFGTTYEGDANNDDWIDIEDYSLLIASYGTVQGPPPYNPHCDFDRSGSIGLADYTVILNNWARSGDFASGAWQPVGEGWGFEIQPNMTEVGPGENFTVNVTAVYYSGAADSWAMYLLFNTTYLEVTGIDTPTLPSEEAPVIVSTTWNNTAGWAQHAYGIQLGSTNYIHKTFVYCTIHFHAKSANGTSHLNFTNIDPANATKSVWIGTDHLNWSYVVNGTVEVNPLATLEGHVSFGLVRGSPPNAKWIEPFVVRGFEPGNLTNELWTQNATTNDAGVFTITGLTPDIYDISIKNWTCLSEVNASVTLSAGVTTVVDFGTVREGDANNNDYVVMADLGAMLPAWNKQVGDPEYRVKYDFNRDGYVVMADLGVMLPNWDQKGDLVP